MLHIQHAHGVHDRDDGNADIGKDCRPHTDDTECAEDQDETFDTEGEYDILIDDGERVFGDTDGGCDLFRVVIHEDDIGGFDRRIRADRAHRDADIRTGKHGSIIDAVSDECKRFVF